MKLKALLPLAAIVVWLMPQAQALSTNRIPGTVVSWGVQAIPNVAPGTQFTKIAAGGEHSLALKSDGTVVAWGRNVEGQSTVPKGLNGVVAIAAGGFKAVGFAYGHSVALKSNGTGVAWGDNSAGQSTVPGGLNSVVGISAGDFHNLALKSDGSVTAWGPTTRARTRCRKD